MAKEIERKFLVKNYRFKELSNSALLYRQGYICIDPKSTVRVRIKGEQGYVTIKGIAMGITRPEYEYEIPLKDAEEMLNQLCNKPIVEKYRHIIDYKGFTWEVDEFIGDNEGLIVAEIELKYEDEVFEKPDFIGEEVTFDHRYSNSNLITNPYINWD